MHKPRSPADDAPFPLSRPHALVASAQDGLALAARAAGLEPGDAVLVPEAHALHPLRAVGLALVEHPGFEGDPDALDALLDARVRGLVLVHHLGFPRDGARWRAWCDERKLLLLEDAREALTAWTPSGPTGSHGHAALFALRGTVGLPGTLVIGEGLGEEPPAPPPALAPTAKLLGARVTPEVQGRRRGAFLLVADALDGAVDPPFADPPEGAAPSAVPTRGRRLGLTGRETPDELEALAGRTPAAPALERLESLAAAEPLWRELAERSENLFATFEWAEAWVRHLGNDRPLHLFAARDADGRALALLPLVEAARRPVRVLRMIGHGPADRLEPICAPADRPAAARALRAALQQIPHDLFLADELPTADGWAAMLGATTLRTEPSPVLATAGLTFDAFLAARSRNFREQVRRRERKLRKAHEVEFRLTEDPAALDAGLDTLIALHDKRWGGSTDTFEGAVGAFHRDFARAALDRGWLRLWTMEVDGAAVAAWYGLRYADVEWFYQSGRDPEWDQASVGFILLSHTVRSAMDDGVREYRLLRGGEEYKGRFSTHDPGLQTAAIARTLAGRAAVAAASAVRRIPDEPRRLMVRALG